MSSFKSCHLACRPPFLHNLSQHGGGQFLSLPHNNINFPDSKNVRSKCAVTRIYRFSLSAIDKSHMFHHHLLLRTLLPKFSWNGAIKMRMTVTMMLAMMMMMVVIVISSGKNKVVREGQSAITSCPPCHICAQASGWRQPLYLSVTNVESTFKFIAHWYLGLNVPIF